MAVVPSSPRPPRFRLLRSIRPGFLDRTSNLYLHHQRHPRRFQIPLVLQALARRAPPQLGVRRPGTRICPERSQSGAALASLPALRTLHIPLLYFLKLPAHLWLLLERATRDGAVLACPRPLASAPKSGRRRGGPRLCARGADEKLGTRGSTCCRHRSS